MVLGRGSKFRAGVVCVLAGDDRTLLGNGGGRDLHPHDLPYGVADRTLVAGPLDQANGAVRSRIGAVASGQVLHATYVRAGLHSGPCIEAGRVEIEPHRMELAT